MIDSSNKNRSIFLFLTLTILFCMALIGLQFSYYPPNGRKILSVSIDFQGVWQDQIENQITNPLEENLLGMKHLKKLISRSEDERSALTLILDDDADLNKSYMELRDVLDRMEFPDGTQKPQISKNDSNALPVFILQLEEGSSEDAVKSLLKQVKGVGQIEISGIPKKDVILYSTMDDFHSLKLTSTGMAYILNKANLLDSIPFRGQTSLLLDLRYTALNDFNRQQLKQGLRAGDFSRAFLINSDQKSLSRVNGEEKIIVWIKESGDANTITLCRNLRKLSDRLGDTRILYDKGNLTEEALKEIMQILLFSLISVTIITVLLLGSLKNSMILCLNIPFSLTGTLAFFHIMGWEVDILVLAGLALSSGLIIDSGVIYLEMGAEEAARPVFFSLFSTLLVFSSFLFSPYEVKIQNRGLIASLCCSLTLSVFFILVIMHGILQNQISQNNHDDIKGLDILLSLLFKFRKAIAVGLIFLLILCLSLIRNMSVTQEFNLPDPTLRFSIEYPAGVSRNNIISGLESFENEMENWNDYDFITSEYRDEKASFHVHLKDEKDRAHLIQMVKQELAGTKGYLYFQDEMNERDFTIRIVGHDRDVLYGYTPIFANALQRKTGKTVVQHFKEQPDQIMLTPKIEKMKNESLSPLSLASILGTTLNRPVLGKWFPPSRLQMPQSVYDIRVFDPDFTSAGLWEFRALKVSPDSTQSLESFVEFKENKDFGAIYHEDALRSLSVSILLSDNNMTVRTENISSMIEQTMKEAPLPDGVKIKWGDKEREQAEYRRGLIKSLLISLALIFLLLLFLYESLFLPLYLFVQILFCHIFSLGVLRLAALPLSSPVFFALILNTGLLINNGLVIFGDYSRRMPLYDDVIISIKKCGLSLFTAGITTLAGLIPLLFNSSGSGGMLPALSLTVSSGILFSLILQVITIPIFFQRKF